MPFVPAVELNRGFYADVVAPIVERWHHSAAFVGFGSQVLGYDDERSTDHGWGLRVRIFVTPSDLDATRDAVDAGLPDEYAGWPVSYGWDDWPVRHYVDVVTVAQWFERQLGFDPREPIATLDWLCTPQQLLLESVRGALYHDGLDELAAIRATLAHFPDDVWRWLLACQWLRVEQEEAFVGRTNEVGDELGSRIIAARLARELMRLHFLYARTYWPYTKWFGTAYNALPGSDALIADLLAAVAATTLPDREGALTRTYETLAGMHNNAGLTAPLEPTVRSFHSRGFPVIAAGRFADAVAATIADEKLRSLPRVGSVDQFIDSTDVLSHAAVAQRLRTLYEQT